VSIKEKVKSFARLMVNPFGIKSDYQHVKQLIRYYENIAYSLPQLDRDDCIRSTAACATTASASERTDSAGESVTGRRTAKPRGAHTTGRAQSAAGHWHITSAGAGDVSGRADWRIAAAGRAGCEHHGDTKPGCERISRGERSASCGDWRSA
jgi:hypothetical protein